MRRSQFGLVVLVSASSLGVCAVGSAKTLDCLQVAVVSQSADLKFALNAVQTRPGIRPLHMILTNVCSVDITAFTLELNVTSPIPQARQFGADMLGGLAAFNTWKIPRAGTEFPYDGVIHGEPEDDPRPLGGIHQRPRLLGSVTERSVYRAPGSHDRRVSAKPKRAA